jgi:hypothetical protein
VAPSGVRSSFAFSSGDFSKLPLFLTGYVEFTSTNTGNNSFCWRLQVLHELQHTLKATSPGAERLQATLAVAFQEVLRLLAVVLAAFPLGFCTTF